MSQPESATPRLAGTPLQRILTALAADRCYACGWPLGSCKPFNCAMRYKDDTQALAEREGWLERQREMSAVLVAEISSEKPSRQTAEYVPPCGRRPNESCPEVCCLEVQASGDKQRDETATLIAELRQRAHFLRHCVKGSWKVTDEQTAAAFDEKCADALERLSGGVSASGRRNETPPITDADRRWRHLEHGCEWVSWTETGGDTHSFDPRHVPGLTHMRRTADEQSAKQVEAIKKEADALLRRTNHD